MGKFIAIEGPDGAGKSTQIDLLIEYFRSEGIKTKFIHFPRTNEGVFGDLIAKFLRGEFGEGKNVHPQLVALLFAEDRKEFADILQQWLEDDFVVLVDRYVLSNIAYQCAKVEDPEEKKTLRSWINMFEYEYNHIPKPDLSIYLDVPNEFTHQSLNGVRDGEEREYLKGKDDIHEKDLSLQTAVKAEYQFLAKTDPSVTRITCYDGSKCMKPIEDIHDMIVKAVAGVKIA